MNCDSQYAKTHVGTPYYMSPEQVTESKYNEKSDIWSLGCIIYEMAALRPPFKANSHLNLAIKIKAGQYDRIPAVYSDELWQMIIWMVSLSQEERASIDDLMQHPRIKQILQPADA
jgi:NIMA (never in mitosis gene a)-related kinase